MNQLDIVARAARRLCDAVERPASDRPYARAELLHALAALYSAALQLEMGGDDFDPTELPVVSAKDLERISRNVEELVGEHRWYWTAIEPNALAGDEGLGCGDLVDDLHDIYADIVPALRAWETKTGRPDAIAFAWVFGLRSHWGNHAVDALRVLHRIVFESDS